MFTDSYLLWWEHPQSLASLQLHLLDWLFCKEACFADITIIYFFFIWVCVEGGGLERERASPPIFCLIWSWPIPTCQPGILNHAIVLSTLLNMHKITDAHNWPVSNQLSCMQDSHSDLNMGWEPVTASECRITRFTHNHGPYNIYLSPPSLLAASDSGDLNCNDVY